MPADEKATGEGHRLDVSTHRVLAGRSPLVDGGEAPVLEHRGRRVLATIQLQDLMGGRVFDPTVGTHHTGEGILHTIKVKPELKPIGAVVCEEMRPAIVQTPLVTLSHGHHVCHVLKTFLHIWCPCENSFRMRNYPSHPQYSVPQTCKRGLQLIQ